MLIKNIIWDWNGTIVNDAWLFVEIMNSILKKNNLPPTSLKNYRNCFGFPIKNYWKGLGFKFTEESFDKLNADFIYKYQQKMFLPDLHVGCVDLLSGLKQKKIRQFILSATEKNLLWRAVNHYCLGHYFEGVYGVDNLNAVGKQKLGRLLCVEHSLDLGSTLIIGDTEYDCDIGKKLGCSIVLVSFGHINHQRLLKTGVRVVASVGELKKHLSLL